MGTTDRLAFTTVDTGNTAMNQFDVDLTKVYDRCDDVAGAPSMTTAQRDALALKYEGMLIYNSTVGETQIYVNAAWKTLGNYSEDTDYIGRNFSTATGAGEVVISLLNQPVIQNHVYQALFTGFYFYNGGIFNTTSHAMRYKVGASAGVNYADSLPFDTDAPTNAYDVSNTGSNVGYGATVSSEYYRHWLGADANISLSVMGFSSGFASFLCLSLVDLGRYLP